MSELLKLFLTGSAGAAVIAGIFSLLKWLLDRRAAKKGKKGKLRSMTDKKLDDLKAGVCMLLYLEIKNRAKAYIARGSITSEELEDLVAMHEIYHDSLGGNGFLDGLMSQVRKLPIKD
ncbi:MAG: hypothetical protein Q4C04_04490 [Clostridia bacterium]|nr:hypothetical protein [Clostridia bacterium]